MEWNLTSELVKIPFILLRASRKYSAVRWYITNDILHINKPNLKRRFLEPSFQNNKCEVISISLRTGSCCLLENISL